MVRHRIRKREIRTDLVYRPPIDLRLYTPEFAIIDENEDFLVVDKPPHLMVHPSVPGNPPTLLDGLQALCAYELVTGGQLSLINRLDRETSGLVLVAKHKSAARTMSKAMERREYEKAYLAIVWGWPEEDHFVVDGPILRKGDVEPCPVWVQQIVHPDGKACRTRFDVLKRFEKETTAGGRFSLLRCHPETGRMHQIRVHAHAGGFPIIGDKLYGTDPQHYLDFIETGWTPALQTALLLNRQALHAAELRWRDWHWQAPLPTDLASFIGDDWNGSANLSDAIPRPLL